MKSKKIIALICSLTMAAASAFALAGCDKSHKHTFETSYQFADCDTEGYTRHTCTTCGYIYADDFKKPLGHMLTKVYYYDVDYDTEGYVLHKSSDNEEAGATAHTEKPVDFSQEQLQMLKDSGKDLCVHEECVACDYENKQAYENLPIEQLYDPEFTKKFILGAVNFYTPHNTMVIPPVVWDEEEQMLVPVTEMETWGGDAFPSNIPVYVPIPDTVEIIHNLAFNFSNTYARIHLPKNLKRLEALAFGMPYINMIVIPKSLQYYGVYALGDCKNMGAVFYEGSWYDWNNKIEFQNANDPIKSVGIYYYSETKPTDNYRKYWHYIDEEVVIWMDIE